MLRKTDLSTNYKEVTEVRRNFIIINFDKVDIEVRDNGVLATWSQQSYYGRPTNEQMQNDVRKYTIQRYINEGLTPPAPEDIDVSAYVID